MDPAETKALLPFVPVDQTSNQRLVYLQMVAPANRALFLQTVQERKDDGWQAILDCMVNDIPPNYTQKKSSRKQHANET